MDIKRKEHIQNINQRLLILEKAIENDAEMLENLKEQGATSFVLAQVEKITTRNNNRKNEIEMLTIRRANIATGLLDEELKIEIKETHNKNLETQQLTQAKKDKIKELKEAASIKSKKFYQKTVSADRENRYREKDMQRAYNNYLRIVDTIPEYISKNLSEMTNNKGYLWRGISCYGEQDDKNSKSTILFERQKGGLLIIHDRSPTDYKVFHKKGKDRKTLYSATKVRTISTGFE